jgi:hypothetical protein
MKKFDAAIPRRMFWSDSLVNKKRCPLCHSTLENEYHHYIMVIRSGKETTAVGAANDYGAFCPECPVVVLDKNGFERLARESVEKNPDWKMPGDLSFIVIGIVNLNAVPEDKRHLPLGGDDNPIPIVEFLREIDTASQSDAPLHKGKRLSGNQRRRRR